MTSPSADHSGAGELVLLHSGRVQASGAAPSVLTRELIARVYAAHVTVSTDPAGRAIVTPVRQPVSGAQPSR